jgi:hypothetical protein
MFQKSQKNLRSYKSQIKLPIFAIFVFILSLGLFIASTVGYLALKKTELNQTKIYATDLVDKSSSERIAYKEFNNISDELLNDELYYDDSQLNAKHPINNTESIVTKNYEPYTIIPIILSPSDHEVDPDWIDGIDRVMQYVQAWYGARLENTTFEYVKPELVFSDKPLDWFKYNCPPSYYISSNLNCDTLSDQIHYYNSIGEIGEHGYPIGSPNSTKIHIVTFFNGELDGSLYLGGGDYESGGYNQSFIGMEEFGNLLSTDPFSIDIENNIYSDERFGMLSKIAHEMAHTFGLSHTGSVRDYSIPHDYSIIDASNKFPHVGFSMEESCQEYQHMLNSPYIKKGMPSLPRPLHRLYMTRPSFISGWNYFSLPFYNPIMISAEMRFPMNYSLLNASSFYSKAQLMVGDNIFKGFGPNIPSIETYYFSPEPGLGIALKSKRDITYPFFGILPENEPGVNLHKGWNLVSPAWIDFNYPPLEAFENLDHLQFVYYYDARDTSDHWKKYDPTAPVFTNDLKLIETGKAYYVKVEEVSRWNSPDSYEFPIKSHDPLPL